MVDDASAGNDAGARLHDILASVGRHARREHGDSKSVVANGRDPATHRSSVSPPCRPLFFGGGTAASESLPHRFAVFLATLLPTAEPTVLPTFLATRSAALFFTALFPLLFEEPPSFSFFPSGPRPVLASILT